MTDPIDTPLRTRLLALATAVPLDAQSVPDITTTPLGPRSVGLTRPARRVTGVLAALSVYAAAVLLGVYLEAGGRAPATTAEPTPSVACGFAHPADCEAALGPTLAALPNVRHPVTTVAFAIGQLCQAPSLIFSDASCPFLMPPGATRPIGNAVVAFAGTTDEAFLNVFGGAQGIVAHLITVATPPATWQAPFVGPTSTSSAVVSWLDLVAPSFVAPTPQPYPTDARPCGPADLAIHVGGLGGAMGNTNLPVSFTNTSASTCALAGYPTEVSGVRSDGTVVHLAIQQGSYFPDPGPPANIAPGAVAAMDLGGADACNAAQDGHHVTYPTLRIGLPGGGRVDAPGSGAFNTICGVWVTPFGVPADMQPAPEASPSALVAQISAPATARAGDTLLYTVTLSNPTAIDYPLSPCPAYTEFVGSGVGSIWIATVDNFYLNCDAAPSIPAGGAVTFAMRLAIPLDQPSGEAKFGWDLQGGECPCANAPLVILPPGT